MVFQPLQQERMAATAAWGLLMIYFLSWCPCFQLGETAVQDKQGREKMLEVKRILFPMDLLKFQKGAV
jgi:hypothetical protein